MPVGFNISGARSHLSKTWTGSPTRRRSATRCYHRGACQLERTLVLKQRENPAGAAAQVDAQYVAISLSSGSGGSAGGSSRGAVMNSEGRLKFQAAA